MPPAFGQPEAVPASTGPTLVLLRMWGVQAEPRLGGPLMKALAAAAPLTGLQHIKRVRKQGASLHVLLCRADWRQQDGESEQQHGDGQAASTQQGQQTNGAAAAGEVGGPSSTGNGSSSSSSKGQEPDLPPAVAEIVRQHSLQPFIAEVPLHAPITREQFVEWGKHWPMTWRCPDASALPHLVELSPAEAAAMQHHMAAAWQLAAANGAARGIANACVIVDPQRDAVVAQAADCSQCHPLQHAAMAAVAAAAEWQLRVWPQQQGEGPSSSAAAEGPAAAAAEGAADGTSAARAAGAAPAPAHAGLVHAASGQLDAADGKRRRLEGSADVRGAAGVAGAAAAGEQGSAAGGNGLQGTAGVDSQASSAAAEGAAVDTMQAAAAAGEEADPGPRPYLCTGYDAYLLHEPCVMCAMALVHSRLRRVIYCVPDAQHGALGGALKLHSQRSLNHHYAVWRLPLAGGGGS